MIKIKTERLIIRKHTVHDLEYMHNFMIDKEIMHYLQDLKTNSIEETKTNLDKAISESKKGKNRTKYFFAIFNKNNNYVGEIGYTVKSVSPSGEKVVHLGYFIHKEYWGKEIMTEAVKAIIEYAFFRGDVHKIETGCLKDDIASEKEMLKCGLNLREKK